MNQLQENLQELLNSMSEEDTAILTENRFPYIFTKAFYFLQDIQIFTVKMMLLACPMRPSQVKI